MIPRSFASESISMYNASTSPSATFLPANIPSHVPEPSQRDLQNGEMFRYFCRRTNQRSPAEIVEISKSVYQTLKSNPMYTTVELRWLIRGKLEDVAGLTDINTPTRLYTGVITANKNSVELVDKEMPGLRFAITNYMRCWDGE